MIQITIPSEELFDESINEFVSTKEQKLQLEHSLIALSKWESKWEKPFIGIKRLTSEEVIDYLRCMTITPNVNPNVYFCIPSSELDRINDYIEAPMTATWFSKEALAGPKGPDGKRIITSELLYYWMIAHNIPFECQKWHLNRLMTLIRVCNIENSPKKKMSQKEQLAQQRHLNEVRRQSLGTEG